MRCTTKPQPEVVTPPHRGLEVKGAQQEEERDEEDRRCRMFRRGGLIYTRHCSTTCFSREDCRFFAWRQLLGGVRDGGENLRPEKE